MSVDGKLAICCPSRGVLPNCKTAGLTKQHIRQHTAGACPARTFISIFANDNIPGPTALSILDTFMEEVLPL
jgi:hypothetical protein